MGSFFSLDSKFMQLMTRIADLVILNCLFCVTGIPIFTIGASRAAVYTVCFQMRKNQEQGIVKSYFKAFASNFKQTTILWIPILVLGTACITAFILNMQLQQARSIYILLMMLMAVLLSVTIYIFPLISYFTNRNIQVLKNALLLSVGYFPRTLVMAVLELLPVVLYLLDLVTFLRLGILWLGIYFSGVFYFNTRLFKEVFAQPETEEDYNMDDA